MVELIKSMLKIGTIGFGGGNALIPVIESEVVENKKMVSKADYDMDVVSACVTPGALPVEIAAGVGKRAKGNLGMVVAATMMALPGALMTIAFLLFLGGGDKELSTIRYLSLGIMAFLSSILVHYIVKSMCGVSQRERSIAIIILFVVFILSAEKNIYKLFNLHKTAIFGLSTLKILGLSFFIMLYTGCKWTRKNLVVVSVLTLCFLFGNSKYILFPTYLAMLTLAAWSVVSEVKAHQGMKRVNFCELWKEIGIWFGLIVLASVPALLIDRGSVLYLAKGFFSSVISFGGGDAYLTVADNLFINDQMLNVNEFYHLLVPIANVLPGSILCKMLTGAGYMIGIRAGYAQAFALALAGFVISVSASGMVFGVIGWVFRSFQGVSVLEKVNQWIRPIISGLLLNVMLTMVQTNIDTGLSVGASKDIVVMFTSVIIVLNMLMMHRKKMNHLIPMAMSAVLGFGIVLF